MIPYSKHSQGLIATTAVSAVGTIEDSHKVQGKDRSLCLLCCVQTGQKPPPELCMTGKYRVELKSLCDFTSGLGGVSVSQEWEERKSTIEPSWSSRHKEQLYPHWVCVCQKYQGCWLSRTYRGMLLCRLSYLDYIRTLVKGHNFMIHL